MSDKSEIQQLIEKQLSKLKEESGPASGIGGWARQKTAEPAAAVGLSVPLKIDGVRVYLHFGQEAAASPEAVMATINALDEIGAPVDRWKPRQQQWSGNNRGWR